MKPPSEKGKVNILMPKSKLADMISHKSDLLAESGVTGLWNFSNMELKLPDFPDVTIQNIHLGDSLMTLCYQMSSKKSGEN